MQVLAFLFIAIGLFVAPNEAHALVSWVTEIGDASTTNNANNTAAVGAVVTLAFISMGLSMLIGIIRR